MADFYFGHPSPDTQTQWAVLGGQTSGPNAVPDTQCPTQLGAGNIDVNGTPVSVMLTTPAQGIIITELYRGMNSAPVSGGPATFVIGIYDVTGGFTAAPKLFETTVTAREDNAGYVWHGVQNLNVAVPGNRLIAIASTAPTLPIWHTRGPEIDQAIITDPRPTGLPATWTANASPRRAVPMRAGYSVGNQVINLTNVGQANKVKLGSTGNAVNSNGLGNLTGLTLAGIAATSVNAPNGVGTFSMPAPSDGATFGLLGAGKQAVATDGTNSPTRLFELEAPDGWLYVNLAGINTSAISLLYEFSPAAENGGQIVWQRFKVVAGENLETIVHPNGFVETDVEGAQTMYYVSPSTGIWRSFEFTTGSSTDTQPNPFTLTSATNVPASQYASLGTFTVQGVTAGINIPVLLGTGVQYRVSINNGSTWGALQSVGGNVQLGNLVEVFGQAGAADGATVTRTITIGGVSGSASVTTVTASSGPDLTPNALSLTNPTGVTPDTYTSLGVHTISGATPGNVMAVVPGNGVNFRVRTNANSVWGPAGTSGGVQNGWQIEVFGLSAAAGLQVTRSISIGGVTNSAVITSASSGSGSGSGQAPISNGQILDIDGDNSVSRGVPVMINAPNISAAQVQSISVRSGADEFFLSAKAWPFVVLPVYLPGGQYTLVVRTNS